MSAQSSQPFIELLQTCLISFIIAYILYNLICSWLTWRSLPPGPFGLPIVGYYPFYRNDQHVQFIELSKKYGPVFSLKVGKHNVVVLNNWSDIKEAFNCPELLAKPHEPFFNGVHTDKSFAELSGLAWREQRRVAMTILHNIGYGKSLMENKVKDEISSFIAELDKRSGQPEEPLNILIPSIANIIYLIVFGHNFPYNDPVKKSLDNNMETTFRTFQFSGDFLFMPFLVKINKILGLKNIPKLIESLHGADQHFKREIQDHLADRNSKLEAFDFIDGFLSEMDKRSASDNPIDLTFNQGSLVQNLRALFGAGYETISTSLSWILMYLVQYPEWQEIIRSEILNKIGPDRSPCYEDNSMLPNLMAFLYEVHRIRPPIPTNLPRRASSNTKIGSTNIPKETIVIFNIWAVHQDPNLWPEPEKFNPKRFLTEDESKAVRPAYHIPFSGGKRICVGERLAYVEIFHYITSILQRYRVTLAPGQTLSFDSDYRTSLRPKILPQLIFEKL